MAIMKKTASKFATAAHVMLPVHAIGKDVILVYEDDIKHFEEIIRQAYFVSKITDSEFTKLEKEFKKFKEEIFSRIGLLERTISLLVEEERQRKSSLTTKTIGSPSIQSPAPITNPKT